MSTVEEDSGDSLEEIQQLLSKILNDQTSRLREITRRQNTVISNITDQLLNLTKVVKQLQLSLGLELSCEGSGHWVTHTIKLDFPKFSGVDVEGWLF